MICKSSRCYHFKTQITPNPLASNFPMASSHGWIKIQAPYHAHKPLTIGLGPPPVLPHSVASGPLLPLSHGAHFYLRALDHARAPAGGLCSPCTSLGLLFSLLSRAPPCPPDSKNPHPASSSLYPNSCRSLRTCPPFLSTTGT